MVTRTFHSDRFLLSVYGTEPFVDYCRLRGIPFQQEPSAEFRADDLSRWRAALGQLPREVLGRVELELTKVSEIADSAFIAHLHEAVAGGEMPSDGIPGNVAVALWFFLHHPDVFHEVFLHEEILEVDSWRNAQTQAGLVLEDLDAKAAALAGGAKEFFKIREGTGRFCAVDAYRLADSYCFVAHVADRLQLFDVFTDRGEYLTQRLRPAIRVLFVYYPADGTLLLKSHLRATHRVLELFQCFGQAVLGVDLGEGCLGQVFNLDLLKRAFHPLPDADDMEMVRVKALHFRYPRRLGRRQVKLETLSGDEPQAIEHLVGSHLGSEGALDEVSVCHAQLQVRLRVEGGSKSYVIRLWPNRCNLNQTAIGQRFRSCLQPWGLYYVH